MNRWSSSPPLQYNLSRMSTTLHTADDLADRSAEKDLGEPGAFPYTRGIHDSMYRGRLWTMRQYAGFGTAEESNRRFRYLLNQGVNGLSVAFDLPTQIGFDSDDPAAAGETGRVGVAIDSIDDMTALFDQIPLDRVSTSMTINATSMILLALYIVVARRQGVGAAQLTGTLQNDILKEYVARGTYIYPPPASLRIVTDVCTYCDVELPRWHPISVSGYHIREAGSTAAQEVAFTFAHAITYIESVVDAGLDAAGFGRRLSFFFNAHNDFLQEIAKFRAARRLWARIMRDRFGVTDAKAQQLRFHTQTAGSTLTAQQPDNNIVRVALQGLSAVLGGTQSLHCNGRDEALGLPTEAAARIALRTQQIIASETGVTNTVDPVGGAWAIERLTNDIENEAVALLAVEHSRRSTRSTIAVEHSRRSTRGSFRARFRSRPIALRRQSTTALPSWSVSTASHMTNHRQSIPGVWIQRSKRDRLRRYRACAALDQTIRGGSRSRTCVLPRTVRQT